MKMLKVAHIKMLINQLCLDFLTTVEARRRIRSKYPASLWMRLKWHHLVWPGLLIKSWLGTLHWYIRDPSSVQRTEHILRWYEREQNSSQ